MKARNFMEEMKHKLNLTEEDLLFSNGGSEEEAESKRQRTPPSLRRIRGMEKAKGKIDSGS